MRPHYNAGWSRLLLPLVILLVTSGFSSIPHLELIHSAPENGSELDRWPERVELTYSGSVDPELSRATLVIGERRERLKRTKSDDDDRLVYTIPTNLPSGAAVLSWTTAGSDGHPVRGIIEFTVKSGR